MTYKLEDARRNLVKKIILFIYFFIKKIKKKDTKWNLSMNLLQMIMNKNKANRDIFDLF